MEEIVQISEKHKIPLVCDEIYYGCTYDDEKPFYSFAHINTTMPLITLGAISKIFCLPGWRLGWIIVYNRGGYFDDVIVKMRQVVMIWCHPCTIIQRAAIKMLKETPETYYTSLIAKLKKASDLAFNSLSDIRGLKPVKAKAAMYMMCLIDLDEFDGITDEVDFCKKLLAEECCCLLPSK